MTSRGASLPQPPCFPSLTPVGGTIRWHRALRGGLRTHSAIGRYQTKKYKNDLTRTRLVLSPFGDPIVFPVGLDLPYSTARHPGDLFPIYLALPPDRTSIDATGSIVRRNHSSSFFFLPLLCQSLRLTLFLRNNTHRTRHHRVPLTLTSVLTVQPVSVHPKRSLIFRKAYQLLHHFVTFSSLLIFTR